MPARISGEIHYAGYLAPVVEAGDGAVCAAKHPRGSVSDQVDHLAIPPKERVYRGATCDDVGGIIHVTRARYLPALIHKKGNAIGSSQRSQILHSSFAP